MSKARWNAVETCRARTLLRHPKIHQGSTAPVHALLIQGDCLGFRACTRTTFACPSCYVPSTISRSSSSAREDPCICRQATSTAPLFSVSMPTPAIPFSSEFGFVQTLHNIDIESCLLSAVCCPLSVDVGCSLLDLLCRLKLLHASVVCGSAVDILNNGFKWILTIPLPHRLTSDHTPTYVDTEPTNVATGMVGGCKVRTSAVLAVIQPLVSAPMPVEAGLDFSVLLQLQEALFHICQSLIKLHEHDALLGVQQWAAASLLNAKESATVLSLCPWIPAMVMQSAGSFEHAVLAFKRLLQARCPLDRGERDPKPVLSVIDVRALIAGASQCYMALADWEGLRTWHKELHQLRAVYSQTLLHASMCRRYSSYLKTNLLVAESMSLL